jgi:transcription antitermination factor NusG
MSELTNLKRHWYAITVKSKHEFKVFEKLQCSNIESFLPTIERLRQWKDRKKLVVFPLFPNYVFVRLLPNYMEVLTVLKIKGVVRFLGSTQGNPEVIPNVQIESLQRLLENKKDIDVYPYLKEGQKVIIKKGPLAGIEGIMAKKDSQQHVLVISIDLLGQSICLKIDISDVDPL